MLSSKIRRIDAKLTSLMEIWCSEIEATSNDENDEGLSLDALLDPPENLIGPQTSIFRKVIDYYEEKSVKDIEKMKEQEELENRFLACTNVTPDVVNKYIDEYSAIKSIYLNKQLIKLMKMRHPPQLLKDLNAEVLRLLRLRIPDNMLISYMKNLKTPGRGINMTRVGKKIEKLCNDALHDTLKKRKYIRDLYIKHKDKLNDDQKKILLVQYANKKREIVDIISYLETTIKMDELVWYIGRLNDI